MTAKEIAEKIIEVLFDEGCWPQAKGPMIKDIEPILSAALEEAINKAFEERGHAFQEAIQKCLKEKDEAKAAAYDEGCKEAVLQFKNDEKRVRKESYEEAAKIAGDHFGHEGPECSDPHCKAAEIRAKAEKLTR